MNRVTLILLLASACAGAPARPSPPQRPNVVVILVDDLGWADLGSYGSDFYETPHIDALAARGVKFTNAYSAAPICSPTRAALLTGRAPARLHLTDWIPGHKKIPADARVRSPEWTRTLVSSEVTLAEALRAAGYATGSIGKWHLGGEDSRPEHHGFDVNVGGTNQGQPPSYFSPYRIPTLPDGPPGEDLTDRLAAETDAFIERHRDRPFFLYLPHFAVHTPIQAKPALIEKYRRKAEQMGPGAHRHAGYAAMIETLDQAMGRLVAKLNALGLTRRTLVVFTSDNGGLGGFTVNGGFRAGKGTAYEGAVRVPLIMSWEGTIPPGQDGTPVITTDLFPTVLDAAGVTRDPAIALDGVSLMARLLTRSPLTTRPLFWHYPHFHTSGARPFSAVVTEGFRLVEFLEDQRAELYDLGRDPGETRDLAASDPARVARLREVLARWRREVGAQMPVATPAQ